MAQKGKMTVQEAGQKGGVTVRNKYGHEFYEEIGKKGGAKGGNVVKQKYGRPFYEEIGHKGGQKVRDLISRGKRSL